MYKFEVIIVPALWWSWRSELKSVQFFTVVLPAPLVFLFFCVSVVFFLSESVMLQCVEFIQLIHISAALGKKRKTFTAHWLREESIISCDRVWRWEAQKRSCIDFYHQLWFRVLQQKLAVNSAEGSFHTLSLTAPVCQFMLLHVNSNNGRRYSIVI